MLEEASRLAALLSKCRNNAVPVSVHPLTTDGRSWLLHAAGWWPLPEADFAQAWAEHPPQRPTGVIFGKPVVFHRYTQAYGVDYAYTGQVARARPLDAAPPPLAEVLRTLRAVAPLAEYNSALVNWYETDMLQQPKSMPDYMGAHSDDERGLRAGYPIVSLSWCAPAGHARRFRLKPKAHVADGLVPPEWRGDGRVEGAVRALGDGDLVVMGGECQRTHTHELLKPGRSAAEKAGRRINLPFRAFTVGGGAPPRSALKRARESGA